VFRKPVTTTAAAVGGWGNERTTPTESTAPAVSMLDFTPGTLWAEPRAYQEFLDDAAVDIEAWLLNELDIIFGENEGDAFINGIGVERPRGILQYSIVANASYAWNSVGYIASGASGAFAASNPSDKLIDLVHALKQTYRNGAAFLMNDATLAGVRKLKDGQGNYIWAPNGLTGGPSGVLLGYPVASDDNMPDIASNSYSIAFGNFKRGYQIVDRQGVTVMRDPFTAKPAVKFFVRKRVGGGIQNFEAIKLMKFATS
jgi:HK97 family phage major capsid protein